VHPKILEQREVWARKPAVRAIYADYYRRILAHCRPGRTIEIGGGSGNLKEYLPASISTDIVPSPWLDLAADAQRLPFASGSAASLVGVDVLHHLGRPADFFAEAERVLQRDGRLILLEPAITPLSYLFYKFFHPEPFDLAADPLAPVERGDPFEANQAIPTLLFARRASRFAQRFPRLSLVHTEFLSLFAYPLSGGFRRWSLLPFGWDGLLRFEREVEPWLGRLAGFRILAVIERRD
jgi:SAM-dependent methyltransferase